MIPPSSSWIFILDFDGTITTKDTIGAIAQFALSIQASKGHDMRKAWDDITARYGYEYSGHIETYKPSKEERDTLDKEIAFHRSLRDIELRSFKRVSSSGLFKGIKKEQWEDFGGEAVRKGGVTVRTGLKEFVERVRDVKGKLAVISVNFSSAFIKGVLGASAGSESSGVEVLANQPDENGVLVGPETEDGSIRQVVATSDAKLSSMQQLSHMLCPSRSPKVVYIGDSGTDIECFMADAVIGVIMSENGKGSLMETLKQLGLKPIHIGEYQGKDSKPIYWARNFQEIVGSPLLS